MSGSLRFTACVVRFVRRATLPESVCFSLSLPEFLWPRFRVYSLARHVGCQDSCVSVASILVPLHAARSASPRVPPGWTPPRRGGRTPATRPTARARASRGGAALLRRRPKGLLPAARQELLDPSKAWWGGRRERLADRPRYSISVSLGVVPLVLPRRGSPSTHRSRGWLRSPRSFRTASAPTKLATRRIRTRAWMKQGYCVAPACTSELHHGRGPGTARPFDDAGGDGTQAPPCRRTRPRG